MTMDKRYITVFIVTFTAFLCINWQAHQLIMLQHSDRQVKVLPYSSFQVFPNKNFSTRQNKNIPIFREDLPPEMEQQKTIFLKNQKKYVALMNEYEFAKIERSLLEQKVAIASAKKRIALLNYETEKLTQANDIRDNHLTSHHYHQIVDNPISQLSYFNPSSTANTAIDREVLHNAAPGESTPKNNARHAQFNSAVSLNKKSDPSKKITYTILTLNKKPKRTQATKVESYTVDEILLLELPTASYTIQLKGSFSKRELDELVIKNNLGLKAVYYSFPKNGKK